MTTVTCPHPERHQTQVFIPCQDCDRRAEKTMTTATSTTTGMTNKQFALARFWRALDEYKLALRRVIAASNNQQANPASE